MKRIGTFFSILKYRKMMAGILCGILLFCCVSIGMAVNNVDVIGEWYMTEIVQKGMTSLVSGTGMGMTITFHNDTTVDIYITQGDDSISANGSWGISNNRIEITMDNGTVYADFVDGKLKMDFNGTPVTLERENLSAVGSTIVEAKSREDFDGFWELTAIESQSFIYSMDELKKTNTVVEGYLTIASGKVHVVIKDAEKSDEIDYDAFFMGGKLYLSQNGNQVSIIQLREDGQIVYEYVTAGNVINMILTRSEKEVTTPVVSEPVITPTAEPVITSTPAPTPEPTPIPNRSIKINTEQNTLEVKKQLKLSAVVERITEDAPQKSTLAWLSSNENVAKVSKQGVVTGVSTGTAIITCYITDSPEIKSEYTVSVIKKATGVKLSTSKIDVAVKKTASVVATILPEDVTDKGLFWASSDTSIATVSLGQSNKCTITARNYGNCTITATTRDGSKKFASVKVHVGPFGIFQSEYVVTSKTGLLIPLQWSSGVTVSISNKSNALFNANWVNDEVFINPKKAGKGYIELSTDSPKEKIRVNIIIESSAVYDKNSYPYFDYSDILRRSSYNNGKKGHIYGKVLQVSSDGGKTILRVGTSGYFMSDKVFWVECDSSVLQVNIIENDKITVFGSCLGTQSYTTVLGASITIPSIKAEKIVFGKIK